MIARSRRLAVLGSSPPDAHPQANGGAPVLDQGVGANGGRPAPRRRVLIVDDDPSVMSAHARYVERLGYDVERAADGFEALSKLALGIDLVLLDINMPGMDGFEVARRIRALPEHRVLPIIMVTGMDRETWYPRALEVGANDVIAKPLNADELRLRTRWLMQLKTAHDGLRRRQNSLSQAVDRTNEDLRSALEQMTEAKRLIYEAHLDTIRRLTIAAEYKDESTAGHITRVGLASAALARMVGLAPRRIEMIEHAAPLHDVGKIGIPDEVLLKRSALNDIERTLVREHTRIGASLLAGSESDVLRLGSDIALQHHEHWDGTGYPNGWAGEAIPIEARICAVVDYFDASTMARPFRAALPTDHVLSLMRESAGTRFDPAVLGAFFECLPEIGRIREAYPVQ